MKSLNASREKDFVDFIIEERKIIHFLKTEGSYDYAFVIAVQDVKELDSFLSEIKTQFKDILNDYFVSIVVSSRIFKLHKLLLGEKQQTIKFDKYTEDRKEIELDEKDKAILRILSQKANISLIDLADETKYSLDIVKYRAKKLSNDLISSFRVITDLNKMGYFHYVLMLKVRNSSLNEEADLITWCGNKKNVMFLTKRIGAFDYEVNIAITDINDLNNFLSEIKTRFGKIIDSYELMINSKLLKLNYLPL